MPEIRNTKQRDAILAELKSRKDHPTAEKLYLDLKKQLPSLSLSTVYRNLSFLESQGEILKLTGENSEFYDGNPLLHYHLTCRNCGRVIDLELKYEEKIQFTPLNFDGKIEGFSLMFFGLCHDCAAKTN